MRIPDELVPLVRELAEAHLKSLEGDLAMISVCLPPSHPRRRHGEHRRRDAERLVRIMRFARVAA